MDTSAEMLISDVRAFVLAYDGKFKLVVRRLRTRVGAFCQEPIEPRVGVAANEWYNVGELARFGYPCCCESHVNLLEPR